MAGYELGEYESRLIAAIYEAALDSTKWKSVLVEICQVIDVDEASLFFFDAQHSSRNFTITAYNTNNDMFVSQHLANEVKKIKPIFIDSQPGQLMTAASIAQRVGMSYEEYLGAPAEITERQAFQVRIGIPLLMGDIIYAAMGFHCVHGAPDLTNDAINFVHSLSPHFVRALSIHNHISLLRAEHESLVEAIKCTNLAVFLLDKNLQVLFVSPEAQQLLTTHPALGLSRNMRLQAHNQKEQLRLEAILAEFADSGFYADCLKEEGICLALEHPQKIHPLKLYFLPVQQQATHLPEGTPCLAVFASDPERERLVSPHYLQQAYGLTVTETQLAQLLLKGLSLAEISNARSTSAETTRWQVKQIMHKTQTHSQAELARLLVLLSNEFADSKNHLSSK